MNKDGHELSLKRLFSLYSQSNNQLLKSMYKFYCQDNHVDEDGNARTLSDFVEHGVIGADYPDSHKCNNIATVKADQGADLIIQALIWGISYWQGESIDNMLTRMYHFYNYDRLPRYPGCSLKDDPATLGILRARRLVDPFYLTYTVIEWIWVPCPMCLGTGGFGRCPVCGGDGEILEELIERVKKFVGWISTVGIDTYFGYYPDIVSQTFISAKSLYTIYKMNALDLYDSNKEFSLIYLGYGLHHLQDVASVPHHSLSIPFSRGHADWENSIDYSHVLDGISWNEVRQEYSDLESRILSDNALPPEAGWGTNAVVFNWASDHCGSRGTDDNQDFGQTAKYMLAAMHHCLLTFYRITSNQLLFVRMKRKPEYKRVYDAVGFTRQTNMFKGLKRKALRRAVTGRLMKARIQKLSKNWVDQTERALARREKPPELPNELSMVPRVLKTKKLGLHNLV